jgi:AraC family transcriptional regulator, regulatory protein of adaptative response / methylated-DNA-[protein]-cysteine methyltransferase
MKAGGHRLTPPSATERDPRWARVVARDEGADGTFWYSVRTTGVYCRPSCPSRLARPENVRFHDSPAAAESAGYRPCARCRPDQPPLAQRHAERVTRACRLIESTEAMPRLADIAQAVGMSPWHFHRVFRSITGVTPRAYAEAHRGRRLRERLAGATTVTDAMFDAGYNSNARFYETAGEVLGMKPTDYRNGGANATIRFAVGQCSLGAVLVASSERGICGIFLGDDPESLTRELQDRFPSAELIGGDAGFEETVSRVVGFVEHPSSGFDLPLDVRGTAFQQRVWQALRDIPAGTTVSYTELARRIGAPRAVRAVGSACGANPVAVAIPCHRVVRTDGNLSGYRWGIERKQALLEREGAR